MTRIPILLSVTYYGWGAIALILMSVVLALRILKRSGSGKPGCVSLGYISLILFIVFSITTMLSGMLGSFVYHAFSLPRYKATVVDHYSYVSESRDKGFTRRTTMYQPIVVFKDNTGQEIKLKSDVASSSRSPLGSVITVGYKPGMPVAEAFSAGKYLLMGGATVMLLLLGYVSVAGIRYGLGGRMQHMISLGTGLLLYVFIPLAMLAFAAGLGYAAIEYFRGDKPDMPVWALVICIFFCFILLLAFIGYVRMLAGRRSRRQRIY